MDLMDLMDFFGESKSMDYGFDGFDESHGFDIRIPYGFGLDLDL